MCLTSSNLLYIESYLVIKYHTCCLSSLQMYLISKRYAPASGDAAAAEHESLKHVATILLLYFLLGHMKNEYVQVRPK